MTDSLTAANPPRRDEMLATLISLVPFSPAEPARIVQIGSGDGRFSGLLLESLPKASLIALESSESRRAEAARSLAPFGERIRLAPFELAGLDWWEHLWRADVVVSVMTLHALNDAKTQYLYKAIAERTSERGTLLIADDMRTAPLFHQLVWLRHAGFATVDCWWAFAGHAVFGGLKKTL